MSTQTNELRGLMTPMLVLLFAIVLIILAALILRHPTTAGADLVMLSPGGGVAHNPASSLPPNSPTTSSPPSMAAAEDRLVKNMAYFDSRFERYTAELHLEEEKALSRSDLVSTRYQLKSLQEDVASLQTLSSEWETLHQDLQTGLSGRQIAGSIRLLDDYLQLTALSLLSERDVAELSEQLRPLSDFVAMLEDQDKVAYEPSERFQSRLTTMVHNVEKAITDFNEGILELKRLQREAQTLAPLDETLQEAVYRRRREQSESPEKKSPPTDSADSQTLKVTPSQKASSQPKQSTPTEDKTTKPVLTVTTTTVNKLPQPRAPALNSTVAAGWPSQPSRRIQPDSNGNYLPENRQKPATVAVNKSPTPQTRLQTFVCSKCGRTWTFQTMWNRSSRCSSNCRCR